MKIFIGLLTDIIIASNNTNCFQLSNQKYITQPTLNNLHATEYSQEFHYYQFAVDLNRYVGSCNTLSDCSKLVQHDYKNK